MQDSIIAKRPDCCGYERNSKNHHGCGSLCNYCSRGYRVGFLLTGAVVIVLLTPDQGPKPSSQGVLNPQKFLWSFYNLKLLDFTFIYLMLHSLKFLFP